MVCSTVCIPAMEMRERFHFPSGRISRDGALTHTAWHDSPFRAVRVYLPHCSSCPHLQQPRNPRIGRAARVGTPYPPGPAVWLGFGALEGGEGLPLMVTPFFLLRWCGGAGRAREARAECGIAELCRSVNCGEKVQKQYSACYIKSYNGLVPGADMACN